MIRKNYSREIQKEIRSKREAIEEEYKCDKDKLYLILEQVARICRRVSSSKLPNQVFVGNGSFTEFCNYLYDNGYDYYSINKYLSQWKIKLLEKL